MISLESLARFAGDADPEKTKPDVGFDMDGYLAKHDFGVIRQKAWGSNPGGTIYELDQCPFNPDHTGGSAAFTIKDGIPGFICQHEGCRGKTIKEVFAQYPVESGAFEDNLSKGQRETLIECAEGVELFHTPGGDSFASLPVGDHREIWPLRSKNCKRWLTRAFYQKLRKPPGAQAMLDALALLEAIAQFDSPSHQVFTRFAPYSDGLYLDLCNEKWEAVEITSSGWRIVQNPPVRFRRAKGMLPLPYPTRGGSLSALRGLINIGDDQNWILVLSWLVAASRSQGPYPILILLGEQGSAKSTTAKLLRGVIDPASAPVRTPPRDERDLLIAAHNSGVVAFDNMSGIRPWLSDGLCRLTTGGGSSTRELYTDMDEVILDVTRPVILNGIQHLAERPDLADRAVILNLPRIEDTARREEKELFEAYERERPAILGALLTAVSVALARLPEIKLARRPRMADFARWATAAEPALGFQPGAFMNAYSGNRSEAVQETLESDPVGAAILGWIGDRTDNYEWKGTNKRLLEVLGQTADERERTSRVWPKTPRGLSGQLRRVATFLRETGIEIDFPDKRTTGGARILTIKKMARQTTASTATGEAASRLNQSISEQEVSGGRSGEAADETYRGDEPPLEPPMAIPLRGTEIPEPVAVVAVVRTPDLVPLQTEDDTVEIEL
jgi:hypothetical protein